MLYASGLQARSGRAHLVDGAVNRAAQPRLDLWTPRVIPACRHYLAMCCYTSLDAVTSSVNARMLTARHLLINSIDLYLL